MSLLEESKKKHVFVTGFFLVFGVVYRVFFVYFDHLILMTCLSFAFSVVMIGQVYSTQAGFCM
jgi:hypothetical protein